MMFLGIEDYAVDQKEPLACCGHLRLLKEYFEELRSFMASLDFFSANCVICRDGLY